MAGFDKAWRAVSRLRGGEPVSPDLKPLLQNVYLAVQSEPVELGRLKQTLVALLEFLQGAGRTNANCWAVDLFFGLSEGWERDWTDLNLPDDFHDLLSMMGEALHDTMQAPGIAQNFDCLPEQLLERARLLRIQDN